MTGGCFASAVTVTVTFGSSFALDSIAKVVEILPLEVGRRLRSRLPFSPGVKDSLTGVTDSSLLPEFTLVISSIPVPEFVIVIFCLASFPIHISPKATSFLSSLIFGSPVIVTSTGTSSILALGSLVENATTACFFPATRSVASMVKTKSFC